MKKLLSIILSFILCLSVVGCSSNNTKTSKNSVSSSSNTNIETSDKNEERKKDCLFWLNNDKYFVRVTNLEKQDDKVVFTYDFFNDSNSEVTPGFIFILNGYQNGIENDITFPDENGNENKSILGGYSINNCYQAVKIVNDSNLLVTMHLEGLKIGAININLDTLEITEAK